MEINLVAIILTIVFNLGKRLSARITQYFQSRGKYDIQAEVEALRVKLIELKKERDKFNPMDQFALYARADRKVNQVAHEIQLKQGEVRAGRLKVSIYVSGIVRVVETVYSLLLIWFYRYTPIFDFGTYPASDYGPESHIFGNVYYITEHLRPPNEASQSSMFAPISYILSFPSTDRCNSIGITFWLVVLNRTIDIIIAKLNKVEKMRPAAETAAINTDIELD